MMEPTATKAETADLERMELDVERLLVPVAPSLDYRQRLRQALLAASSESPRAILVRSRSKFGAWLLSVASAAMVGLVIQSVIRAINRQR